jgi:hypothetical protein
MSGKFHIDEERDNVLRRMEQNMGGNPNYCTMGAAWLTYKAGRLNNDATARVERTAKRLVSMT